MDLTETIAPRSDQINADDLMAGPRTVTITDVKPGAAEQPVDIIVSEFPGRAYRPSKSMRRIIVSAWGPDSSTYIGRALTLYRDPSITFGREQVGGIRISHLSHIDKPLKVPLTVTRGKRQVCTVQPLAMPTQAPEPDWTEMVALAGTVDELRAVWQQAHDAGALDRIGDLIAARRADLDAEATA